MDLDEVMNFHKKGFCIIHDADADMYQAVSDTKVFTIRMIEIEGESCCLKSIWNYL